MIKHYHVTVFVIMRMQKKGWCHNGASLFYVQANAFKNRRHVAPLTSEPFATSLSVLTLTFWLLDRLPKYILKLFS
jgi:hypothetical protein